MLPVRCILALAITLSAADSTDESSSADREAPAIYEIVVGTAIEVVPADIRHFLTAHADTIRRAATAVAVQHTSDEQQAPSHYVMLDVAAESEDPIARRRSAAVFPRDQEAAAGLYQRCRVSRGGRLPWTIAAHFELLVRAFESGDQEAILQEIAMLAHFSADAALPFNTTADRDGTETNHLCWSRRRSSRSIGPHCTVRDRCQNALVEIRRSRFEHEVRVWPGRFQAPADPLEAVFATLIGAHSALGAFVEGDEVMRRELGITDFESFQARRSQFYAGLASQVGEALEERLESGALLSANLIGTAWIRAGRPSERFFSILTTDTADAVPPKERETVFVGSRNSEVFHRDGCPHVQRIRPENLIRFPTVSAARAAGRTPCRQCKPDEPVP